MSFDADIAAALEEVREVAGRDMQLRRGAVQVTVTATPAATRSEIGTFEGARFGVTHRDYIVPVAAYDFGTGPVVPLAGDVLSDGAQTFELTRLGDTVPAWEWSDRGHTHYRLHTQEI